jgi:hypothetical protein
MQEHDLSLANDILILFEQYYYLNLQIIYIYPYTKIMWHDAWKPEVCSQRSTAETSISRQRLTRHVSAATNMHTITEEPLKMATSIRLFPKL